MISGSLTGAFFANAFVLNARFRDRKALNGNAFNGRRRHGRNDVPDLAVPGHEADEGVLAQRDLAVAHCGAVGQHLTGLDVLAHLDDGALVDAGACVGAGKLDQRIVVHKRYNARSTQKFNNLQS